MNRDSFFDNYRGFLIILVVIGHFVNPITDESHWANIIITGIYSFHMPAFVFVSAYFSKRNSLLKLVKNLLIPYFIFQIVYSILINTVWGLDEDFYMFEPAFSLWFLLSLFTWRILIDKLALVRWILPISFIIAIIVPFDRSIDEFLSLGRSFEFLPYFLMGYYFDRDMLMYYAEKKVVKLGAVLLLAASFLLIYLVNEEIPFQLLTLKFNYEKIGLPKWGWLYRTALYAFSTLLIYLFAVVIPKGRHWYTYLGQRTFGIYIFQGLIFKSIYNMTDIYKHMDSETDYVLITLFAVALTFVLSIKPLNSLMRKLTELPVEKLLIQKPDNTGNNT